MYEAHFGLQNRPFGSTTDRSAYYPAAGHEGALAELERGLADEESPVGRAIHVVLLAQPIIGLTLSRPELTGFAQRLAIRPNLDPLPADEAADYLLHQVRAAGGQPEAIFDPEALALLARGSGGIP